MKRDQYLVKNILTIIEENRFQEILDESMFPYGVDKILEKNRRLGHLKLLTDNQLIEGVNVKILPNDGEFIYWTTKPMLTTNGHDFLDSMRVELNDIKLKPSEKDKSIGLDMSSTQLFNDEAMQILD